MKEKKFIKLTDFESNGDVYLRPEAIIEITGLAKTDNFPARTRVTTAKNTLLVKEPTKAIMAILLKQQKGQV